MCSVDLNSICPLDRCEECDYKSHGQNYLCVKCHNNRVINPHTTTLPPEILALIFQYSGHEVSINKETLRLNAHSYINDKMCKAIHDSNSKSESKLKIIENSEPCGYNDPGNEHEVWCQLVCFTRGSVIVMKYHYYNYFYKKINQVKIDVSRGYHNFMNDDEDEIVTVYSPNDMLTYLNMVNDLIKYNLNHSMSDREIRELVLNYFENNLNTVKVIKAAYLILCTVSYDIPVDPMDDLDDTISQLEPVVREIVYAQTS